MRMVSIPRLPYILVGIFLSGCLFPLTACGNLVDIKQVGSAAVIQEAGNDISLAIQTCGYPVKGIQSTTLNLKTEETTPLDKVNIENSRQGRFDISLPQLSNALANSHSDDVYILIDIVVEKGWKDQIPLTADPYIPGVQLHAKDLERFAPGTLIKSSPTPGGEDFVAVSQSEQEFKESCQQ